MTETETESLSIPDAVPSLTSPRDAQSTIKVAYGHSPAMSPPPNATLPPSWATRPV